MRLDLRNVLRYGKGTLRVRAQAKGRLRYGKGVLRVRILGLMICLGNRYGKVMLRYGKGMLRVRAQTKGMLRVRALANGVLRYGKGLLRLRAQAMGKLRYSSANTYNILHTRYHPRSSSDLLSDVS